MSCEKCIKYDLLCIPLLGRKDLKFNPSMCENCTIEIIIKQAEENKK